MASAGLPGHLYEMYASYKRGTAEVIRWLHEATGQPHVATYINRVRELENLADVAVRRQVTVPSTVLHVLRTTVLERVAVGRFFRGLSGPDHERSNSNHAYFTGVLVRIYEALYVLREGPVNTPQHEKVATATSDFSNLFDLLTVEECRGDGHEQSATYQQTIKGRNAKRPKKADAKKSRDVISEYVDSCKFFVELEKLFNLVQESWKGVVAGTVPLPVAGFINSTAFDLSMGLHAKYLESYGINDINTLLDRYESCNSPTSSETQQLKTGDNPESEFGNTSFHHVAALREISHALRDFKSAWKPLSDDIYEATSCGGCQGRKGLMSTAPNVEDDLTKIFTPTGASHNKPGNSLRYHVDLILKRMGQLLEVGGGSHTLCQPLVEFLQNDDDAFVQCFDMKASTLGIFVAFGLLLLLESLKVYYAPSHNPNTSNSGNSASDTQNGLVELTKKPLENCRQISLILALDIASDASDILESPNGPCKCFTAGGQGRVFDHIRHCLMSTHSYYGEQNFDIFHQSPWVAGLYMVDHLAIASLSGNRAWHFHYHVGTLMHIYNSLTVLGILEKDEIKIMESLCSMFSSNVFLGSRPQGNLWSSYQVWCGARLRPKGKNCHDSHEHENSRRWALERVEDRSQGGANPSRKFVPWKVSILARVYYASTCTDDEVLAELYTAQKTGKEASLTPSLPPKLTPSATASEIRKARRVLASQPFIATHVAHLQTAILSEFTAANPVAKINYFRIYLAVVDILRRITAADHAGTRDHGANHICGDVPELMLCAADCRLRDSHVRLEARDKRLFTSAAAVLRDALGGKTLVDFTWEFGGEERL